MLFCSTLTTTLLLLWRITLSYGNLICLTASYDCSFSFILHRDTYFLLSIPLGALFVWGIDGDVIVFIPLGGRADACVAHFILLIFWE
jgi:hypothetical protein